MTGHDEPGAEEPLAGKRLANVADEGERVVRALASCGMAARLLGGVGVAAHRHGPVPDARDRPFADIDLAHDVRATDVPSAPGLADALSLGRLIEITRADWGWCTTFADNLAKVGEASGLLDEADTSIVRDHIGAVAAALEAAPKTTRWKARAIVGRRAPWYELPEEVIGGGARR